MLLLLLLFVAIFSPEVHIVQNKNWNMLPRLFQFDTCKGKPKCHIQMLNATVEMWSILFYLSLILHLWPYHRISSYGFYFTLIGPKIKTIWFIDLSSIVLTQCVRCFLFGYGWVSERVCACDARLWCVYFFVFLFLLLIWLSAKITRESNFFRVVSFFRWLTKGI